MAIDFSDWGESQSPEADDVNFRWRIIRASHLKPTKFAVISVQHYGIYTHYYRRRTVPHLRTGCDACQEGMLPRWYGYILALLSPTKEHIVFEFSAKAAETIIQAERDHGSLRGLVFTATRPKGKENSPVVLQLHDTRYNPAELPTPEPVRPIVAHIWGYKDHAPFALRNESVRGASEAQLAAQGFDVQKTKASDVVLNGHGDLLTTRDRLAELLVTHDDRFLDEPKKP